MSCYVIGIGGTGAKCVEALIHLCAAGLMPDKAGGGREDLYVAFVDPDTNNGSLDRARETLGQYARCRVLKLGTTSLFKTPLNFVPEHVVWSPFANDARPRLDTFFRYNALGQDGGDGDAVRNLFDVLYSREEKETTLEKGFRGHPSIGAAVLASTLRLGEGQPWQMFRDRIQQDIGGGEEARIILVGSIFGGTGAAGLPTIARLIRNEFGKDTRLAKIGGVLVLPYFSFDPVSGGGMRADSENFLLSTQAALKYYHQQARQQMDLDVFNTVYAVGESELSRVKTASLGASEQRNEQHFIELYAALGCLDFFRGGAASGRYQMVARASVGQMGWEDLPAADQRGLRQKLLQLTRFAFAYLASYHPMLMDIELNGRAYRAPWFVNLIERANVPRAQVSERGAKEMREYCESYLLWLANVVASARNLHTDLVNYNAFAEKETTGDGKVEIRLRPAFDLDKFDNLFLPEKSTPGADLNKLWSRMSEASVADSDADGLGKFFRALYDECGR